jgi:hypothetical protein
VRLLRERHPHLRHSQSGEGEGDRLLQPAVGDDTELRLAKHAHYCHRPSRSLLAQVRLDVATQTVQTHCQDNGFLSLKFTNGVWPFPESSTPPGEQN